jgi:hypothetical protein
LETQRRLVLGSKAGVLSQISNRVRTPGAIQVAGSGAKDPPDRSKPTRDKARVLQLANANHKIVIASEDVYELI